MTARLQEAIQKVQKLPTEQQEWFALLLLDVLKAKEDNENFSFAVLATPEQRVAAFDAWVDSHFKGSGIPLEALRRVNLYD